MSVTSGCKKKRVIPHIRSFKRGNNVSGSRACDSFSQSCRAYYIKNMKIEDDKNLGSTGSDRFPMIEGSTFDEKYVIGKGAAVGGMAAIYRATELTNMQERALKLPLSSAELKSISLSFAREEKALSDLSHNNIVILLGAGNVNSTPYLVLEWLAGGDLRKKIEAKGAVSWGEFYETLGRPLLKALVYSHQRNWAHRDLKPQNILFDMEGVAKIIDFGIARQTSQPRLGMTFSQAGSPPYTPPEPDEGYRSDRRDLYSWAAVATSCLTGKIFLNSEELVAAVESLREFGTPKAILRRALAQALSERHETASVLLAELDAYHSAAIAAAQVSIAVPIEITPNCIAALRSRFPGLDDQQAAEYIVGDLNTGWSAFMEAQSGDLQLVGTTLRIKCKRTEFSLVTDSLNFHVLDRAREIRESYPTVAGVTFNSKKTGDFVAARDALRTLIIRLDVVDSVRAQLAEEKRRAKWFDCWFEFLRDKERQIKIKQREFFASRIDDEGEWLIATIDGDFDANELGPSLVQQTESGKPIILTVVDVAADQVRLLLRSGRRAEIKRKNSVLQTNFEAERKSLQKQRAALEDIRGGRAVSPDIGQILSEPRIATPPEPGGMSFPDHLSADKRQVLDKAMEVSSLLVVNGPPGTGKTTLIAELISAYLKRYPDRRILLSSQTHIALDHIIAKLETMALDGHIVRIISPNSENANKVGKAAENLTLDRKVKEWCLKSELRSETFVQEYAEGKGVDVFEVKTELLGRAYVDARNVARDLKSQLTELAQRKVRLDGTRLDKLVEGISPDPLETLIETESNLAEEGELEQRLSSTLARMSRLEDSLNKLNGMGVLFKDASDAELEDLLAQLTCKSEEHQKLLPLIKLHLDWLNRLGSERSFHGAVLREARIVAGTCIGLGGTPAFQFDQYDLCIIDEASKATATETLVPMSRSRRTILVGDPKQLPPYIEAIADENGDQVFSDDAKKSLLSVLLSELPKENIEELVEQRRMCSTIGELVSNAFYEGKLVNVRSDDERGEAISRLYPNAVLWLSTSKLPNRGEAIRPGETYINEAEAHVVIEQLKEISRRTRKSKKKLEIAVIAAYSAQVAYLRDTITQQVREHPGFSVEVNTVDAFQGREADVCIYSVTRSNKDNKIGFQREKERLNVALSRARDALIIVGDAVHCREINGENPFRTVIDYILSNPDYCQMRNV